MARSFLTLSPPDSQIALAFSQGVLPETERDTEGSKISFTVGLDASSGLVYVSPTASEILGSSPFDLVGKDVRALLDGREAERVLKNIQEGRKATCNLRPKRR